MVIIEDCLIDGAFGGGANGISDERTAGGELYISNSTVRNAGNFGIAINPAGRGAAPRRGDRQRAPPDTNNFGIIIGNNGRVVINRSVISGNFQIGIGVTGVQAPAEANISNSVVSANGLGIGNLSGTVTIRLSNNDIAFDNQALFGVIQSHGNNRIQGDLFPGPAHTPISLQ